MALSNEIKIGSFVTGTVLLAVIFAWAIGVQNPFDRTFDFYVTYNFAGGIEVGSPVRVSGIKVGKVEKIDFYVQELQSAQNAIALKEPGSAESPKDKAVYPVRLQVSVKKEAIKAIRKDSRFYINLAGIIGERYIEITAGSLDSPLLKPDEVIAGIDPPRIDQLISQSFDLFGKIKEVIQENKGDIAKSIEHLYKLSENLNKTLGWVEKSNLFKTDLSKLTNNLIAITADVKKLTERVNSPEGEKTLKLLYDLLWRLEPLNSEEIHKFFQKEGIRARIF